MTRLPHVPILRALLLSVASTPKISTARHLTSDNPKGIDLVERNNEISFGSISEKAGKKSNARNPYFSSRYPRRPQLTTSGKSENNPTVDRGEGGRRVSTYPVVAVLLQLLEYILSSPRTQHHVVVTSDGPS